jgi:hypothetical protein
MGVRNSPAAGVFGACFVVAGTMPCAASTPLSAGLLQPKLNPGYHHPDLEGFHQGALHDEIVRGFADGTLQSLPSWTQGFTVEGKSYSYTLLGTNPSAGPAMTVVPTILVPIKLTIPSYIVNGAPLVLDATHAMQDVIDSPVFTASKYDSGNLQFADAMLHAEFPTAPKGWHINFTPSVAPTVDVTTTADTVQVYQTKSGKYLALLADTSPLDQAINKIVHHASPETYVVIVTYNALYSNAFGFHGGYINKGHTALTVYTYTSWLEGVNDAFVIPSPNADTLAHEIAESTHDPFSTSLTKEWGDWFGQNRCFQPYIEVGDAVEDAPAKVQNYHQKVQVGGKTKTYVLQTEAMLPWFERQYPSTAIHGAYSFPGEQALLGPAPFDCVHGK